MGGEDIDHFGVEGGRLRHLEGCFTLPCRYLVMYLYSDNISQTLLIAFGQRG